MLGFTWYSITDQVDRQHALREERGELTPVGLFDLDRRIRPVGEAYRRLIATWGEVLPTQDLGLPVPVEPTSVSASCACGKMQSALPSSAASRLSSASSTIGTRAYSKISGGS